MLLIGSSSMYWLYLHRVKHLLRLIATLGSRYPKKLGKSQCRSRGHTTLSIDDFIDPLIRDVKSIG
ncbi:MAG: hypothetical protein WCG19_05660 [Chlorobiaceae bacterium]